MRKSFGHLLLARKIRQANLGLGRVRKCLPFVHGVVGASLNPHNKCWIQNRMAHMLTGTTVNGFNGQESNNWVEKYSERHRFQRVTELPSGISLPKKVRIYQRFDHFVLQWWDRQVKKTLSTRVDGDLIEAITKAREIDEKLLNFRRTSAGPRAIVQQPVGRLRHRARLRRRHACRASWRGKSPSFRERRHEDRGKGDR